MFTEAAQGVSNRPARVITPEGNEIIDRAQLRNNPDLISAFQKQDYKKVDKILSVAKTKMLKQQSLLNRSRTRGNTRALIGNRSVFPLPKR
jgi:hypothetical protein